METWFIIFLSLCISALIKYFLNFLSPSKPKPNLPPGPLALPIIKNLLLLRRSFSELGPILRKLHAKHGPLITLRFGSRTSIFAASHSLAHEALILNGAIFADRPRALPTSRILNGNQRNISSAAYGPTWRCLRRNLTSEILHPSRIKSFSHARSRVLHSLTTRLKSQSQSGQPICVLDHFRHAMFSLLSSMCFGDELDDEKIGEIQMVQQRVLLAFTEFRALNFWPKMGKILFPNRWKRLMHLRKSREDILGPLIRTRMKARHQKHSKKNPKDDQREDILCYVGTLMDLELPEERRKLEEGEMVSLCSEFLTAGVDTTSTALQWIMANVVKYPHIQEKLFEEISGVFGESGEGEEEVREEDLHKMPYLKAVILEGLRRHPPTHFVLPHAVTEDVELGGYFVPKKATINFMVADMGRDPDVWEDPMAFKPERFLLNGGDDGGNGGELFDVTGSREIKMMPFGAGRRMCPGYGLAMLHLEYFVANLVWHFEWEAVDGGEVDLSEKLEFTTLMKNPLGAHLTPRAKQGYLL
ncbi:cytochrome P450 89A2-like [Malania oleifera]|uniref:cytochrome P450 89A2-like n=1 Tax=Malania oleifera TaxID=397392 RepID=UPI0025AE78D9|nr:cytochrome P450 89A2-like [Malania oleifera]